MMDWPPHLILHGTPSEVGEKHGEVLRDQIHALFEVRMSLVCELAQARQSNVQQKCEDILRYIDNLFPAIADELTATSRAAGVNAWKLVLAGGFSDVLDLCSSHEGANGSVNECSLIVTTDDDGQPLLVGTWDTHGSAQGALITVERKIDGGPTVTALSTAGWPMQQGVTEYGLAFAIANMGAVRTYQGVSYISALPAVIGSKDVQSACLSASKIPHCSARYYLFADDEGHALGIEHEGRHAFEVSGFDAHTNHFVSSGGADLEGRPSVVEESTGRRQLMQSLFAGGSRTLDDVFNLLCTTDQGGYSIMKLGDGSLDRTCAAFAISPTKRKLWYTAGPPKFNHIQELSAHGLPNAEGRS